MQSPLQIQLRERNRSYLQNEAQYKEYDEPLRVQEPDIRDILKYQTQTRHPYQQS